MAHFAQLNSDNEVIKVVVVANTVLDLNGSESESQGITHLQNLYGADTVWKQCSYHGSFRKQFPARGFKYDANKDAFIRPQPYASWTLDATGDWQAPVTYPTDGKLYGWNETDQQWEEMVE